MQAGFKRVVLLSVLVVAVVIVAYVLGSATGAYLKGREQNKIDNDRIAKRQADTRAMAEEQGGLLKVGTVLSNHIFSDLDGNPVTLAEVLKKRTVLTVFSTNCDYCKEEMDLVLRLAKKDIDWQTFIFISGDSTQALRAMRDTMDSRMQILYDKDFEFAASFFGFVPFPFTIITDETGTVQEFMVGTLVESEIKDILAFNRKRKD